MAHVKSVFCGSFWMSVYRAPLGYGEGIYLMITQLETIKQNRTTV